MKPLVFGDFRMRIPSLDSGFHTGHVGMADMVVADLDRRCGQVMSAAA